VSPEARGRLSTSYYGPHGCSTCGAEGKQKDAHLDKAHCTACGEAVDAEAAIEMFCPACGCEDCLTLACPECGGHWAPTKII